MNNVDFFDIILKTIQGSLYYERHHFSYYGCRYGQQIWGLKQIDPIAANGEIILGYSVYDAIEAGFDKVVFVIKHEIEEDFKEIMQA